MTHYHSTCYACVGTRNLTPGGDAYATESMARADADETNAQPYMRDFGSHHQIVAACDDSHCRIRTAR